MELNTILEALKGNEELRNGLLNNITSIEGGSAFIENANKSYFSENLSTEVSKIYNGVDNDIFELTGKRKEASQKTYDFVKETIKGFQDKISGFGDDSKVKEYKDKIAELEDKVKNGESSSHWKQSFEEIRSTLETKTGEYENQLKDLRGQLLNGSVQTDLNNGLTGLSFNKDLPQAVVDSFVSQHKSDLMQYAKVENGAVTYHDAEGKPILDKQYRPATAKYLLEDKLKEILATNGGQSGGGAKNRLQTSGSGDSAISKLVISTPYSTRQEWLSQAEQTLAESGITRSDERYQKSIDEAYVENKISDLPIN